MIATIKVSKLAMNLKYTCHIAVGIPKTAIGVTAILPTAIAVAAMTAMKSIFLDTFGPFFYNNLLILMVIMVT